MSWTHTSRGRALDLADPRPDDVDLAEIVQALSQQCRYAGNTRRFYSIAEHSVLISDWLRAQGHTPEVQLAGLMHDAAEAYTGDITWPMQQILWAASPVARSAYKVVQNQLDACICARLGFLTPDHLHSPAVVEADLRILLDERAELLDPLERPRLWYPEERGMGPLGVRIRGWAPGEARYNFAVRLHTLTAKLRLAAEEVARG